MCRANLVASDVDETDYCVCNITPKWTGPFTIRIRNWGSVYNRYLLTAE
ncbi:MAG TPA: hypothetical protein VNL70_06390 [Tepidisphaeraceae bacterium]|nr:hypothetical protein [Tepidisphaeraceae bacterium]